MKCGWIEYAETACALNAFGKLKTIIAFIRQGEGTLFGQPAKQLHPIAFHKSVSVDLYLLKVCSVEWKIISII